MGRNGSLSTLSTALVFGLIIVGVCVAAFLYFRPQAEIAPTDLSQEQELPIDDAALAPSPEREAVRPIETIEPLKPSVQAPATLGAKGAPTEIAGYVRNARGDPISDATVQLVHLEPDLHSGKPLAIAFKESIEAQTVTDAEGRYRFDKLSPGGAHTMRASAPGYVVQFKDRVAVGLLVDFTLNPGARVEGRILDADSGTPVAGAEVKGWYRTENVTEVNRLFRWQEIVKSDAEGRFNFDAAPQGKLTMMFFQDEYEDLTAHSEVVLSRVNALEFKMKRGVEIRGVVRDKLDDSPIPGVNVQVADSLFPRYKRTTDAEGRFMLKGVAPKTYRFAFSKVDYTDSSEGYEVRQADHYDPELNNVLVFRIDPAGKAAGRVLDPDGIPVDNARVFVAVQNPLMKAVRDFSEAKTGRDGSFLISNLNANASYTIAAHKEGFGIGVSSDFVVGPREIRDDIDFKLRRPASISGTVADEVGNPIVGVILTVEIPPYIDVWFRPGMDLGQARTQTIVTGPDGRYLLSDAWRGNYTFSLEHPDHVPVAKQKVEIREDEQAMTHDFTMRIGRSISGRVDSSDRSSTEGAIVVASHPWSDRAEGTATVDTKGNYRIGGLVTGQYRVQARKPGYSSVALQNVPGDSTAVNFLLEENGSVIGAVVASDGSPVAEFSVKLTPMVSTQQSPKEVARFGPSPRSFSDPGGRFHIDDIDPGIYQLTVTSPAHVRGKISELRIPSGAPADAGVIRLPQGASVRGNLFDSSGAPVTDVVVTLQNLTAQEHKREVELQGQSDSGEKIDPMAKARSAGSSDEGDYDADEIVRNVRPSASGEYYFGGLMPGRYQLRLQATRHVSPPLEILELADGQQLAGKDFRLPLGAQVILTVVDDVNEPVAHAHATLKDASTGRELPRSGGAQRADAQGKITIPSVSPGKYVIKVDRPNFLFSEIEVDVVEGGTITRTVKLDPIVGIPRAR